MVWMKQSSTIRGRNEKNKCTERSRSLAGMQEKLSKMEGTQRSFTNLVIQLASFGMLALTVWLYGKEEIGFEGILTCTIAMDGFFRTGGGTVQSVQQFESDAGKRRESSVFIGRNTDGGRNLRECGYKKSKE